MTTLNVGNGSSTPVSHGIRHGVGVVVDAAGMRFEGEFRDGLRNGMGCEYYSDGTVKFRGEYERGVPRVFAGVFVHGAIQMTPHAYISRPSMAA